jgi:glycosyltransferase involved in cell wall biosynthesis
VARLKLALFAPYLPAPAHSGGRIRIDQFVRALGAFADVHLFASADARDVELHERSPELALYATTTLASARFRFLPGLERPARVLRASPARLAAAFRAAHARHRFAAAVVEHVHAAGIAASAELPWVLDEHNVESDYLRARLAADGRDKTPWSRFELARLERWERAMWARATEVVCVATSDAELIRSVRRAPPVVLPNGVALDALPFRAPSERRGHQILFVGVLGHPPNVRAARFLAEAVLPRVRLREPRASLVLCGADPRREVRALANEHVIVTGRVPSVTPFLDRAAVYANAVNEGAGTSLKVLEALAAGIPLISTRCGARGFALEDPTHYLAAESASEFAARILDYFEHRAARDGAAARARAVAEAHDFSHIAARFAALVERVATRDRRPSAAWALRTSR